LRRRTRTDFAVRHLVCSTDSYGPWRRLRGSHRIKILTTFTKARFKNIEKLAAKNRLSVKSSACASRIINGG
jgi:hypothetical protein